MITFFNFPSSIKVFSSIKLSEAFTVSSIIIFKSSSKTVAFNITLLEVKIVPFEGEFNTTLGIKLETFTKRNDKYFFHKLSKKYNAEEAVDFFVSNFLHQDKAWIGNLAKSDGHDIYFDYKKRKDSFTYQFRNECNSIRNNMDNKRLSFDDLFMVNGGQHPIFFKLLLSKQICNETFVVFEELLGFTRKWNKEIEEKVVWPIYAKRLKKFAPFLRYNRTETKLIMKEIFN